MIHVLCPNPAIDKLYRIDGFEAGEDYPGQRPQIRVGGKGVNVARVLSQLGAQTHLFAFLGEEGAQPIRREMQARCACTFVTVPGACRTTVNVIDGKTGRETVITEAGPCVTDAHVQAMLSALCDSIAPGDIVCCSGSLACGAPADLYARVSRLCRERGARCALDCNAATLPASLRDAAYALVKPNDRELCALLGEPRTRDAKTLCALARRLIPGAEAVLVSMGAQGGLLVEAQRACRAQVAPVRVSSTVGSGDACFAGALFALSRGMQPQQTLMLAMACGVVNAMGEETGTVDAAALAPAMQNVCVGMM